MTDKPVDFLVNNAGFGLKGDFVTLDSIEHQRMVEVNVTALVRLTHAAARAMTMRKHGDIINLSSVAAFTPALRPSSTYAATKAFVAAFSEGLAPSLANKWRHHQRGLSGLGSYRVPRTRRHQHGQAAQVSLARTN